MNSGDHSVERRKDYFNLQLQLSEVIQDLRVVKVKLDELKSERKDIYKEMRDRDIRINNIDSRFSMCQATHDIKDKTEGEGITNTRANIAIIISAISAFMVLARDFIFKVLGK